MWYNSMPVMYVQTLTPGRSSRSPKAGTVRQVFVAPDQFLNEGDAIVELG